MERRTMVKGLGLAAAVSGFAPKMLRAAEGADGAVYELRVYTAAEGKLPELLKRFREHTTKLFEGHGIKNVAYWTATDEPKSSEI